MKKILFSAIALAVSLAGYAQWKPAGDKIKTTWAEQIDPNNVLPEYPRPIMERKEWKNLNGLWEYAIRPTGTQQHGRSDIGTICRRIEPLGCDEDFRQRKRIVV
jgi:hypothetical protein